MIEWIFLILFWYYLNGIKSNLEKISESLNKLVETETEKELKGKIECLKHIPYLKKEETKKKKKAKK